MKKNWYLLLALLLFVLVFTVACNMPDPSSICDSTEDLVAPVLEDPPMWSVVDSLNPTLSWSYSGDCAPEEYRVNLHFIGGTGGGRTEDSTPSWTPMISLEPGTEYGWSVQPMIDFVVGPIAGRNYFFTGPMCETADLIAPDLLEPADGAVINDDYPSLIWDYPDPCLPEGYAVNLSTDPGFADTSLNGGTGNPSTRWGPGDHLADCTEYFWRVAPINDTTLGPFSDIHSFRVDVSSSCFPEISITIVDISGIVWHDMCPVDPDAGLVPSPLPKGCIEDDWGKIHADGKRQADEPGIEGVVVELGSGPCPSSGLDTAITNGKGFYTFKAQTPGEYCISVNAEGTTNAPILLPGQWTLVPSGHMGYTFRHITLGAGEGSTGQDFGWDYAGLAPRCPFYRLDLNAFCRGGPGQIYHEVTTGQAGERLPIAGRIQDNSWFLVQIDGVQCWISEIVGSTECDLREVPVLTPLDPTDTPKPEDKPDEGPDEGPYCAQFTSAKVCNKHEADGCTWNPYTNNCAGP